LSPVRGPAAAQRYEALTTDTERLQQLVDEIRDLVDEVDRARTHSIATNTNRAHLSAGPPIGRVRVDRRGHGGRSARMSD